MNCVYLICNAGGVNYIKYIDNKFIDDFYSFYDDGKNEYDYTIDFDKLVFWLGVQTVH